jgi:hypothetical protein
MAAPAGSGAVEAYKKTKSPGGKPLVSAAEFVPKASESTKKELVNIYSKVKADRDAALASSNFLRPTGMYAAAGELPAETLPKGGRRKSRRRRRGGALTKPLPELLMDLQRNPSKATLENVISDFKASGIRHLEQKAPILEHQLRGGAPIEYSIEVASRAIETVLAPGDVNEIPFRRRGGAMVKGVRELLRDLETDPSKSTLENVLSDLKASGNDVIESYARGLEENLREPLRPRETMESRVRTNVERVAGILRMYGRGRRRKTTRRRK